MRFQCRICGQWFDQVPQWRELPPLREPPWPFCEPCAQGFRYHCRMCGSSRLEPYLDLGWQPPADAFLREDQFVTERRYPLRVALCTDCGLSQLTYVVPPEILYQRDYPYEGSQTRTAMEHWREFARSASVGCMPGQLVVDIGSGVGALLQAFKNLGMRVIGVEPAPNIAWLAGNRGIPTLSGVFFSLDTAMRITPLHGQAAIITATNVFAHVDDLDEFMRGVEELLDPLFGRFIFEAPYLPNLIAGMEWDTVYHEHLSYLSIKPLVPFFAKHGFRIIDIQRTQIHGGSFRVTVGRGSSSLAPQLLRMIESEELAGIYNLSRLKDFARDVGHNQVGLKARLQALKAAGHTICGVSAPAKGMTLLNSSEIGREALDFVTEKSELKMGKFTPGGHIPVVDDQALYVGRPDYALLLAWNFADEIRTNLAEYERAGGRFIVPIPEPRILETAARAKVARDLWDVAQATHQAAHQVPLNAHVST